MLTDNFVDEEEYWDGDLDLENAPDCARVVLAGQRWLAEWGLQSSLCTCQSSWEAVGPSLCAALKGSAWLSCFQTGERCL